MKFWEDYSRDENGTESNTSRLSITAESMEFESF